MPNEIIMGDNYDPTRFETVPVAAPATESLPAIPSSAGLGDEGRRWAEAIASEEAAERALEAAKLAVRDARRVTAEAYRAYKAATSPSVRMSDAPPKPSDSPSACEARSTPCAGSGNPDLEPRSCPDEAGSGGAGGVPNQTERPI